MYINYMLKENLAFKGDLSDFRSRGGVSLERLPETRLEGNGALSRGILDGGWYC